MKYFVITDTHGFYEKTMQALSEKGFDSANPDHTLIVCGDLMDRGPDAYKLLQFVNSLERKVLIRGNHEDLIEECFQRHNFLSRDFHNATNDTIAQLAEATLTIEHTSYGSGDEFDNAAGNQELKKYLASLVDFAEIGDYIFVHGWIPVKSPVPLYSEVDPACCEYLDNWRDASPKLWYEARWMNGQNFNSYGLNEPGKTIVCGHWHCNWGHRFLGPDADRFPWYEDEWRHPNFKPFTQKGIIALDACTAYSGIVNCVVLEIE